MEISAAQARAEAAEKTGLSKDEIGIFFISPCAAKATFVKGNYTVKKSEVDGVIPIKDICIKMSTVRRRFYIFLIFMLFHRIAGIAFFCFFALTMYNIITVR